MKKLLNNSKTFFILSLTYFSVLAFGQKIEATKEEDLDNKSLITTEISEVVKDFKVFDQNIRVSFGRSSAFYYLPKKHIQFSDYKKLIEDSKNKKIPLLFKMKAIKNEILTIER